MDKNYAVVVDGIVQNIVVWDGVSDWAPSSGVAVLVPDGEQAHIGLGYVDEVFEQPEMVE